MYLVAAAAPLSRTLPISRTGCLSYLHGTMDSTAVQPTPGNAFSYLSPIGQFSLLCLLFGSGRLSKASPRPSVSNHLDPCFDVQLPLALPLSSSPAAP